EDEGETKSQHGGESESESEGSSESESRSDASTDEVREEVGVGSESETPVVVIILLTSRPSITRQPTVRRVPGHVPMLSYGCADLIRVTLVFVPSYTGRKTPSPPHQPFRPPTLSHLPLPFAPCEPRRWGAVWVRHDRLGDLSVFNSARFATNAGFDTTRESLPRVPLAELLTFTLNKP
ncbi:hypothetical protein FRC09_011255, partial [Ceratobasidium sp. 395]